MSGGLPLPAAEPGSWPEIDDIDPIEARARWCGDAALFLATLAQLFERFADVCEGTGEIRLDTIKEGARRMHKLRGAVSSLGARGIYFLAGQLEGAYLAQDLRMAAHLKSRLAGEMRRLRASARPVLDAARSRPRAAASRTPRADPRDLRRLDELLARQDIAALALFRTVSGGLEQLLGHDPYERLLDHMENLRFEEAARDLRSGLDLPRDLVHRS